MRYQSILVDRKESAKYIHYIYEYRTFHYEVRHSKENPIIADGWQHELGRNHIDMQIMQLQAIGIIENPKERKYIHE